MAKVRGDKLAYRFVDFSTERDGVYRDLKWADFGARNRAIGARLQQVTQPGDRIAILCPQNLDYLVAFFARSTPVGSPYRCFDPNEPGHVGRLHAVLDDCSPSAVLTTTAAAEGVRKFFRTRPANQRPRVIAVDAVPRGRLDVGTGRCPARHDRLPAVHLRLDPHPDRCADHPPQPGHERGPGHRGAGRAGGRPGVSWPAVLPRHGPDHRAVVADARALHHLHDALPRSSVAPVGGSGRWRAGRRQRGHHLGGPELRVRSRRGARRAQGG